MSFQPSLLTRWIPRPAAVLQRSCSRATQLPSAQTATLWARQPIILSRPVTSKEARRSLSTTAGVGNWAQVRPRPGLRSVHLPKQRHNRRHNSGSSSSSSQSPKEGSSLSQRLRKLSREYGWAAVGVYFALSALDFPFCFVAVRLLGVDRIGHFEHVVVQTFKDAFRTVWPEKEPTTSNQDATEAADQQGSLAQAETRNQEEASIWTQLALAYAIHKSFIFIRVPLTAAVTPKVVKTLRRWGWDIGKRKPKSSSS